MAFGQDQRLHATSASSSVGICYRPDAIRKQNLRGRRKYTRVWVPYNEGLYSPEMNEQTYAEVCRRAENMLLGGFPVVVDGAFKYREERVPVVEAALRTGAPSRFSANRVRPGRAATPHSRVEATARNPGRMDGSSSWSTSESISRPPTPNIRRSSTRSQTDGPKTETRAMVDELLRTEGLLPERRTREQTDDRHFVSPPPPTP